MDRKRLMRWIGGGALVGSLLTGGVAMQGAFAQTPSPATPEIAPVETKPQVSPLFERGPGFGERRGGRVNLAQATATVTGLTLEQVRTELAAGKTFAAIAEANGKTADDVVAAALKQLETELAQAVTDGKLTQDAADAQLTQAKTQITAQVNQTAPQGGFGGGRGGPGADRGGHGPGARIDIDGVVASVTGLTEDQVHTELAAGKTPAQIAEANGKTADDLVAAALKQLQTQLDQAVADGTLTQAEADAQLTQAKERITAHVNQTAPQGGPGGRHGGPAGLGGGLDLVGVTAEVTGLTREQVRSELGAGKSLAQVAEANGKTADDILSALRTKGEEQLTQFLDRAKQELSTPGTR